MKRLFTIGVSLMLGLSLVAGCGGGGTAIQTISPPPPPHSPPPPPTSHIYIWDAVNPSVANGGQTIYAYTLPITTKSAKVASIADGGSQNVLAFDATHRLFVTQNQSVEVFTQSIADGATSASFNLKTSEDNPQDIKIGPAGDVFVAGTNLVSCRLCFANTAGIDVFTAPVTSSSTVAFHIAVGGRAGGWTRPVGMALDRGGNLWAGDGHDATMFEYAPPFSSTSVPTLQFPIDFNPSDLAFDSAGNMYAAGPGIVVYTPPFTSSTTKAFTISLTETAHYLAFDSAGNLYVTTGNGTDAKLLVFSPPFSGASVPAVTLVLPGSSAMGVAIGP